VKTAIVIPVRTQMLLTILNVKSPVVSSLKRVLNIL
jgi:hypothetical protein